MATTTWGESDIAVIGMAGQFPGARTLQQFWQNLCQGVESIAFPSDAELLARGVDPALLQDPSYVKASAVMQGIELFDAAFFGYTPREAELMDPQHRLFLSCAWHTLEHAGYDPERYRGAIGVFGGGTTNTYLIYNLLSNLEALRAFDPMQIDVSNGPDFVTTRVAYKLNLRGPAFSVQTACSTALVAIHLACQSLLNEECDMALAGGVSVHVKHPEGYWYLDGGNVSPDGHCRAFDARGAGTIFGSGVAMVLLKRMEDAIADHDHIHALIKGSAINNDGSGKVGFTAPSVEGQAGVITEALALADVEAESIGYVETHGTATRLGDPIEIRALTRAFQTQTSARQFCAIGSVKTNVGHLASAAGAASFIKTVLMLEHGLIPPSLHFEQPNPEIDFANSAFYVNTQLREWPAGAGPRRAGVSSFGVGGTNAHAILEQAPAPAPSSPSRPWQLLLLSAKTETALAAATANLAGFLREQPHSNLADLAFTLQVGRQAFRQRRLLLCQTHTDALQLLETPDAQRVFDGVAETRDRPVVFLFPGMGDQYVDMALGLYQSEPSFRAPLDRCAELLKPLLGLDLREVLYPHGTQARSEASAPQVDLRKLLRRGEQAADPASARLMQTELAHPILFSIEYALARMWMEWGLRPRAMIGHSIGEYVAACLSGVFTLEDALALISQRARLIQQLPAGAMLAVLLSEAELQPYLNGPLWLAAVNTPGACVVSGEPAAIAELQKQLLAQTIACQPVQTGHAFHSPLMAPIEQPLRELLSQMALKEPGIPFFSNVTGTWISAAEATSPEYWARHMLQTVRFADGLQQLLQQPNQVLLELGPGLTISALARQHPAYTSAHIVLASLRQPHQQLPDALHLAQSLGRLWLAGVEINWNAYYKHERRQRLALPGYPFDLQRYWIEARASATIAQPQPQPLAERKTEIANWFYYPGWRRTLAPISPATPATGEYCLLFADQHGLALELSAHLAQAGQTPILVQSAEQFARLDNCSYLLDLRRREDYAALLADLAAQGQLPQRIVHCASLSMQAPGIIDTQLTGFDSLTLLAQAIEEQGITTPLQLWVLSDNLCQVEATDKLDPAKISLLAACKVIPQEYPQISCQYLDLGLNQSWPLEQLLAEIQHAPGDMLLAYRGRQRWVQSFEPLYLPAERSERAVLRERGVYVINDGLDGVGWALARFLVTQLQARLLLIEAADFPAPAAWDNWLSEHPAQDRFSRRILNFRELQAAGADLLLVPAITTDAAALTAALEQARTQFGAIHGLIHALGSADTLSFSPIAELNAAERERQLQPLLQSVDALARALAPERFDFCMLVSSLSAVLGGLGQAIHAAASLTLDALAEQHNRPGGTPWISVDWDVWQPDAGSPAAALNAALARYAIAPADGVEAARRILAHLPASRIIVSTGDPGERIKQRPQAFVAPGQTSEQHFQARHPRPNLASAFVAPRSDLERTIAQVWQEVFGLEQIGIDDNFFDLGGNSLIAIHSMGRLKRVLHADVPTAMLYQRPTIRFLAELLAKDEEQSAREMAEQLARRKAELSRRNQVLQRRR